MIRHSVCPLCKSKDIASSLKCTDHLVSEEEFEIFKCSGCGFFFTQNYPEESKSVRYYESEEYISHSDSSKTVFDKMYQLARKIMLNRKKRIVKKVCGLSTGIILDIGSGTGHFLNSMKKAGWKTEGVEINIKAREYAGSIFNLDLLSPLEIQSLSDQSFDCITLWHVLEHFHEPFKYFQEIKRLLKLSGAVIVALPNIDSYDSKFYGTGWAAYDVPRHIWHFNPAVFSLFANENGFCVSSHAYLPFDVFYISILSEKQRGARFPLVSGIIRGFIFSLYSYFMRSKSSSIVYVLRNPGI
jgi:2-polyprenyl-3-methyl-5-hydroxy-6-metoxy-1,4-benzoquinol methylase